MPDRVHRRAVELARGGSWVAPPAEPAATVLLLREGPGGLETMLMRRPDTMAFAPGMHVFPGGRLERGADDAAGLPWASDPPGCHPWWADAGLCRALLVAAVRETLEEAGVMLAVDGSGRPTTLRDWDEQRARLRVDPGELAQVLAEHGLSLAPELLNPVGHWVTPEVEARRFDTRFFAAALPDGQQASADGFEALSAQWCSPSAALAQHERGDLAMLPPTVAMLRWLAARGSLARAMAPVGPLPPLMPRPFVAGEGLRWALVNAYTGQELAATVAPRGSEEFGARGPG